MHAKTKKHAKQYLFKLFVSHLKLHIRQTFNITSKSCKLLRHTLKLIYFFITWDRFCVRKLWTVSYALKCTKPVINIHISEQSIQLFLTYSAKQPMLFKLRGISCSTFGTVVTPFWIKKHQKLIHNNKWVMTISWVPWNSYKHCPSLT